MYREDYERRKKFTRRALILAGVQLGMIGVLGGRLYQLQVLEADRFKTLADDNRINMKLLVPPRGRIFDRNGKPLAVNRMIYRVLLTVERATAKGWELRPRLRPVAAVAEAVAAVEVWPQANHPSRSALRLRHLLRW